MSDIAGLRRKAEELGIEQTGMDNVGLHLDTFHMHLEEKNSGDAIRHHIDI